MIDERQHIMDAIYDWVAAVVAKEGRKDPVIWNYSDGPRPKPPFISLEFTGTATLGMPEYSMVEVTPEHPNGVQTITRPIRRALTMYGFGDGALDLLETIKASYEKEEYISMLSKQGLVIPDALEVRENPAVRDGTDTETSALFDFYVTYTRVIEDDSAGYIDTVHIMPPDNIPMEEITNEEE